MREPLSKGFGVRIVPMSPFDIPGSADILWESGLWQRYGLDYDSAVRSFMQGIGRGEKILVAKVENQVLGFIWFALRGIFDEGAYIRLIGVRKGFQRRGIGSALMQAAEEIIFQSSSNIFLLVADFNTPAQQFYEKLGYRKIGELKNFVVQGVTEWIYRKTTGPIRTPDKSSGYKI